MRGLENRYSRSGGAPGFARGVDAVEEFSVLTRNHSAAYGGTSGGAINAVSRSGTSALHADKDEFLRKGKPDARNFFDGRKPPLPRNQFGAALAGFPVTVPPPRERREDIPVLVRHSVQKFANQQGKATDIIPDVMAAADITIDGVTFENCRK